MKAFEARQILANLPDDTEVTLTIGKLLESGKRTNTSGTSQVISDQPHDYGPYGYGVDQNDR